MLQRDNNYGDQLESYLSGQDQLDLIVALIKSTGMKSSCISVSLANWIHQIKTYFLKKIKKRKITLITLRCRCEDCTRHRQTYDKALGI